MAHGATLCCSLSLKRGGEIKTKRKEESFLVRESPCFPRVRLVHKAYTRTHTVQTRIHTLCAHCPAFESGSATSSLSLSSLFSSISSSPFLSRSLTHGLPVKAVEIWFTYVIRVSQPPACFHRRNWTVH